MVSNAAYPSADYAELLTAEQLLYAHTTDRERLVRRAARIVGDEHAEDVVQNAAVRILQRDQNPDAAPIWRSQEDSARAYLSTVVRNGALDTVRREKIRQADSLDAHLDAGHDYQFTNASTPSPEHEIVSQLVLDALLADLKKISPDQADAFEHVALNGQSLEDYAAMRGMNKITARTRVFRAREKLKVILKSGAHPDLLPLLPAE